jgi:hypothetical protein
MNELDYARFRGNVSTGGLVKRALTLLTIAVAFAAGFLVASHSTPVQGQAAQTNGWAAIPGEKGGWDLFGPYEPVANWPKPLSTLSGQQG